MTHNQVSYWDSVRRNRVGLQEAAAATKNADTNYYNAQTNRYQAEQENYWSKKNYNWNESMFGYNLFKDLSSMVTGGILGALF